MLACLMEAVGLRDAEWVNGRFNQVFISAALVKKGMKKPYLQHIHHTKMHSFYFKSLSSFRK